MFHNSPAGFVVYGFLSRTGSGALQQLLFPVLAHQAAQDRDEPRIGVDLLFGLQARRVKPAGDAVERVVGKRLL